MNFNKDLVLLFNFQVHFACSIYYCCKGLFISPSELPIISMSANANIWVHLQNIIPVVCIFASLITFSNTESSKYYTWPQMGCCLWPWLACWSASGPLYLCCFQTLTVLFQFIFRVDDHAHRRTFSKQKYQSLLIVIIVIRQCCKCSYCDYCDL